MARDISHADLVTSNNFIFHNFTVVLKPYDIRAFMLNQAEITSTLESIPWFSIYHREFEESGFHSRIQNLFARRCNLHSGRSTSYLYIILEGKVSLDSYVPGRGKLSLVILEYLDVLGWSSLTPVVRQKNSTARVLEHTKLLAFNAKLLMEICEKDCDLGFIIMRRLANIVATHMLNHRLRLLELLTSQNDLS